MAKSNITLKDIRALKEKGVFSRIPYFDATGRSVLIFPLSKEPRNETVGLLGARSSESRDGGIDECLIYISASDPKSGHEATYAYIGYAAHNPVSDIEFDFDRYSDIADADAVIGTADLEPYECVLIPYEMVRSAYLLLGKTERK